MVVLLDGVGWLSECLTLGNKESFSELIGAALGAGMDLSVYEHGNGARVYSG
jgi:hypothetical protein